MPDGTVRVVGHEQRAVMANRDTHGATPYVAVTGDKSGHEIVVFTGRLAVTHDDAYHVVAGAFRSVPGAMLGGKCVAAIVGRELRAGIKGHPKRGRMRLKKN